MTSLIRAFKALLPQGLAFNISNVGKFHRKFWNAIATSGESFVTYLDAQYFDMFPQTTRNLADWEATFGLTVSGLTEQQRRDNLEAAWQETGGQTKAYIQAALRARGFDAYVYDWWVTGTTTALNPNACEYLLKNKITFTQVVGDFSAGEDIAEAGGVYAEAGGVIITTGVEPITVPTDVDKWRNFIYISGSPYGNTLSIPTARKAEFDALVLKLRPLDKWVGINPSEVITVDSTLITVDSTLITADGGSA